MNYFILIMTFSLAFKAIVHAQVNQSQTLTVDDIIFDMDDGELEFETASEEYLNIEEYSLDQELILHQDDIADDSGKTLAEIEEERKEAYLLPPAVPVPRKGRQPIYTRVLDMDETLIHYEYVSGPDILHIRPHSRQFLEEMAGYYEIVVFTGGMQGYADRILDELDPNGYISHRLYRHHTITNPDIPDVFVKDLDKIGRDLSKTLIVDNTPENFKLQVENGLPIDSYYGESDNDLLDLVPFLKSLVENQVQDVRVEIKKYKEQEGIL